MSLSPKEQFAVARNYSPELLNKFEELPDPRSSYVIAMTPRSGSSFFCDVLKKTKNFGNPDERLNQGFLPNILERIPGPNADIYLRNLLRFGRTRNGISGLKTSWFQFENFTRAMAEPQAFTKLRFVYLYRRDLPQQAVSLYLATESNVFHTNIAHTEDELGKLQRLEYNYAAIDKWHEHILRQERGWKNYFDENGINPLSISYEDIVDDLPCVLRRFARHVGVQPKNAVVPAEQSIFKKIGDARNYEWACRYQLEKMAKEANSGQ